MSQVVTIHSTLWPLPMFSIDQSNKQLKSNRKNWRSRFRCNQYSTLQWQVSTLEQRLMLAADGGAELIAVASNQGEGHDLHTSWCVSKRFVNVEPNRVH